MQHDTILVGAGRADITPAMGIQIAGAIGMPRPTEEIRARIYADAVVIRTGGTTVCIISASATSITRRFADPIRRECAAILNTTPEAIVMHVTQSHSSPAVGDNLVFERSPLIPEDMAWLYGGDPRYNEPFHRGVVAAVRTALAGIRPATAKAGRAVDGRIAFNRRFIFRDGSAHMHPGTCHPEVLVAEGPADPEVGMVIFEDAQNKAIAALLHFTSHPCHGYGQRWIHPDWPGTWGDGVRALLGEQCIPVAVNGFCGNIHHANHLHPTQQQEDTIEHMTGLLMEATARAMTVIQPISIQDVRYLSRRIPLPWRVPSQDELANAQSLLTEHQAPYWVNGEVPWNWLLAIGSLQHAELVRNEPAYSFETQLLRIGDFILVAMPGEPFVEAQLELKLRPPVPFVFCVHDSNDSPGYFPTRKAFEGKGYETVGRFLPGCLEDITHHAAGMLKEIGTASRR